MSMFVWNDKYIINVKEIDAQHKRLFEICDSLYIAMKSGKSKDVMGDILKNLIDYTANHFATEERLMTKHAYPDYLKHKKEHEQLVKQVINFQNDFQNGKATISVEIMNFLKDWLYKHILGTDKKTGEFLNTKGIT